MKILAIVGGPVKKLDQFVEAAKKINIDFTAASFSDLSYDNLGLINHSSTLLAKGQDISEFDIIYVRVVGKRVEDVTLLMNYAKEKGIKVVDKLYMDSLGLPSSLAKSIETQKLIKAGIPMPRTIYGSLNYLVEIAPKKLGFPFVIKSTTGKKAREVWAPQDKEELTELLSELRELEKNGSRYFAQEFVKASQRYRAFVVGGKVVTVLNQPTKWRKRFSTKGEGDKGIIENVPVEIKELSLKAARAADLDISGVDILVEDQTGRLLVIEANAAPAWKLVEKYTGMNVAEEILRYLMSL